VAAFTSSEEELNKADIQGKSAEFTCRFSGKIDSKGRITVPARIRDKLNLESGEKISLKIESRKVIQREFDSEQEALSFISGLEEVKSFSYNGKFLEVVLDG
jgi:AbrB family looped-hinge helix DNA binding protein